MYTGYKELILDDTYLAQLYDGTFNLDVYNRANEVLNLPLIQFTENEYLIVKNRFNEVVDYFQFINDHFIKLKYPVLGNEFTGIIKPRNPQQFCAMNLLKDKNIPIKLITGGFGTGKTLCCITAALEALYKGEFEKIIFVRNNVQVKDTDQLGSLPGSIYDKTLPYLMPFADHCGGVNGIQDLISQEKLEVIPLGFLRGRSIRYSIIYSMESENLTKEHIQLILGRADEGSEVWLDGDLKQRDRISFEKSKGLETLIERLAGNELFGYVNLVKSERSEIARVADLLD